MNPDLYDFEKMKARFSRYLIEKGMRKTTERFMILDHICRIQGHFDVEMLHKQLDERLSREIERFRTSRFTYEYHSLYVYGICSKCKFRMTHRNKRSAAARKTEK